MKKHLTLTTPVAAALSMLSGCSTAPDWDDQPVAARDTVVCTDDAGEVVDDGWCRDNRYPGYSSYYYRRGAYLPFYGDSVRNSRFATGSLAPQAGVSYAPAPADVRMTRSTAMSRGGLGSTGRSFGGGRS
jgi:hypothetical protein